MNSISIGAGAPFPAGATVVDGGVNFSVFSRNATAMTLRLYSDATSQDPIRAVCLDPGYNRDRFMWHVFVSGIDAGVYYTWSADGRGDLAAGHRFDFSRELVDPFAREVSTQLWARTMQSPQRNCVRGRVVVDDDYDWDGDKPLVRALEDEVIYELHVGGFTRHASANVKNPGTFAGVTEKIPYLKRLGVTAVELLPIMAFDELDVPEGVAERGLKNYWGYSTLAFFAPHPAYASSDAPRGEFRDMVKALHRAGIAVILDVVFNHTAEGGSDGPIVSFKGLDNRIYYHLEPEDLSFYRDYTGCGNTVNCNHPVVADFIVKCLEYWVEEMHVDGFRFDLASAMSRDETGAPDMHARVLWNIEQSPILRSRMLIAEAWDAVGLHQLGHFPGYAWSQWNDRYRDDLRAFLRGDPGCIGPAATRIAGSSDLFSHAEQRPRHSINFLSCHDGFTLFDLVSYNEKHNESNGEDNADGHNHNVSWNSGVEGPTQNAEVNVLRLRRVRNLMALLLLSQGVPMFVAGDERLRTQHGNNNAYCQDNAIGWLDWSTTNEQDEMCRFTREMIALRQRHVSLRRRDFIAANHADTPTLHWFADTLQAPNWDDRKARILSFQLAGNEPGESALCVFINMSGRARVLPLPAAEHGYWKRLVDTAMSSPEDILPVSEAPEVSDSSYMLASFAVAVFEDSRD